MIQIKVLMYHSLLHIATYFKRKRGAKSILTTCISCKYL